MYLYGASGHGKVIKEILLANNVSFEAFIDDNQDINVFSGCKVLHDFEDQSPIIVSIGSNHIRRDVVERIGDIVKDSDKELEFGIAIHPSAVVSPTARIGEGTVIMAGAIINADAVIGKHCIINTGATIDHDCMIEDYCHIAPGVNISGATYVGEGTWIGVGSCVIQCLKIGKGCMIGAGSVVVRNIPDNVVAYGNPCHVIRTNLTTSAQAE